METLFALAWDSIGYDTHYKGRLSQELMLHRMAIVSQKKKKKKQKVQTLS